jgi:hypothetical protein
MSIAQLKGEKSSAIAFLSLLPIQEIIINLVGLQTTIWIAAWSATTSSMISSLQENITAELAAT